MLKEAVLVLWSAAVVVSAFEYDPAAFRLGKKSEHDLPDAPEKRQQLQKILLRYGKRSGDRIPMDKLMLSLRNRRDFRNCFFSPVQCYMREGAVAKRAARRK